MKWLLKIKSGFNDGTKKPTIKEEEEIYEGNYEDVVKEIEKKHFMENDYFGNEKLQKFGNCVENWTVTRLVGNGEFRAIYRLYPYEEDA